MLFPQRRCVRRAEVDFEVRSVKTDLDVLDILGGAVEVVTRNVRVTVAMSNKVPEWRVAPCGHDGVSRPLLSAVSLPKSRVVRIDAGGVILQHRGAP